MAKAKEDTAFYRYTRFTAVNEVGCDPELAGISVDDFHDFATNLGEKFPTTMTTLSTHDTKRSTDVRARLASLTEFPREWEQTVAALESVTADQRSELLDGATINLLWQTLAGTWRLPGTAAGSERRVSGRGPRRIHRDDSDGGPCGDPWTRSGAVDDAWGARHLPGL